MLKVCILDDYQDVIRHLKCFQLLDGYDIVLSHRAERNPQELAKIIGDAEVLVLTRERTVINEELLRLLPHLKLISQTDDRYEARKVADQYRPIHLWEDNWNLGIW